MSCQELLLADNGAARAREIDLAHPNCCCEACSLSTYGPVAGEETLVRFIFAPQHVNKKGRPRAAALSSATTIGLSTFREALTADDDLLRVAQDLHTRAKAANAQAALIGVLLFPAGLVKSPCEHANDEPICCTYDVPHSGVESHADILQRVVDWDDQSQTLQRQWLFDQIGSHFVPASEYRGGLLAHLT